MADGMTRPRQVLPGTCYLLTRRCTQRQFLLRPSEETDGILRYALGVAAQRFGIVLHALCVMSSHYHAVVTDPNGTLPAFAQYFHSLVGRGVNHALGRRESLWAPGSYSAVALQSASDVVSKIAYVLANPVAAGLVAHGSEWPGAWSGPSTAPDDVPRPTLFFNPRGRMPMSACLSFERPGGFDSALDFDSALAMALATREAEAAARMATEQRTFHGAAWVLAQEPTSSPTTTEPLRALNPRVASRDTGTRIEALSRLAEFVADYRAALAEWRKGVRNVLFPPGTYLMRRSHGVCCAGAG
jgi:REP element-mobilizing transposase RayT